MRRVLVFWIVALAIAALAAGGLYRLLSGPTPEERARQEATRIQERVRDVTH